MHTAGSARGGGSSYDCIAVNALVSLFCDSNVRGGSYEWSHIHTHTHTHIHTHIHTYTHDNYYNPRCAHAHRGLITVCSNCSTQNM